MPITSLEYMRDRVIMNIDMNAFYASVAQHPDPSLRNKVVTVAGDPERRSGIIAVTRDNYKEFAWPMPVSEMIYVGPATMKSSTPRAMGP